MSESSPLRAPTTRSPLSRSKRRAFVALLIALLTMATMLFSEVTVRLLGYQPRGEAKFSETVEPGGSLYQPHPTLGCQMRPGHYRVTLGAGYPFSATHMANTLRVTAPDDRPGPADDRPELWLLGDSFTYGYGVDDEDTFPWRLQAQLPEYKVVNFGVPAYSTVQSCVQLREALAQGRRPRAAVALYFAEHDSRNTMLRGRRQIFHFWNRLGELTPPYARLVDGQLQIVTGDPLYRPFPLVKQSAAMNAVEQAYVGWEQRRGKTTDHLVTEAVILQMAELCKSHNTEFLVAGFSPEPETLELMRFCQRHAIAADNIQYDWQDPDNSNWPADGWHPSPLGHQRMADNLECTLKLGLLADDYRSRLADPTQSVQAHVDLGIAHWKQSWREKSSGARETQSRQAIEHLRAAVELDGKLVDARVLLADALALTGERAAATQEYRRALEVDPASLTAALHLARLLVSANEPTATDRADALRLAEQVCGSSGDRNAEQLHVLALAQQSSGKLEQAQESAVRALELATLQRQLGLASNIDRDLAEIIDEYTKAHARHEPESPPVQSE